MNTSSRRLVRFAAFELDVRSGELRKRNARIRLQEQPLQILRLLVEHAGEWVSRDTVQRTLWPEDTFVDFDAAINTAVRKLRRALGDSVEKPRFVETRRRYGYRFLIPVDWQHESASEPAGDVRIESIAVLPFENLTADVSHDYFVDGITDALITDLAQIRALRVISRTSVMRYKGARKALPQIARELNVDAIVEGTVIRAEGRVRVNAQLVHAPTDRHLWAQAYDRETGDILLLQRDLARTIANEIRVNVTPTEQTRLAQSRIVAAPAYEACLEGRFYWNKRTEEGLRKGIACFERAIAQDTACALAYAGLADCYNLLGATVYGAVSPAEAFPRAKAAATRAIALDPTMAEAHTALAWAEFAYYWNWAAAERAFQLAIELNPGYATAHHWYAFYLTSQGRRDEALAEMSYARRLDPLSLIINTNVGVILFFAREYDEAIRQFRRALELDPTFPPAHWSLQWAYEQKGLYSEAIAEITEAVNLSRGTPVYRAMQGHSYAVAGRHADARQVLDELVKMTTSRYVSPFEIALVHIGLGDTDEALRWLDRACEERAFWLVLLRVDPRFDRLRPDPAFESLARRVGL